MNIVLAIHPRWATLIYSGKKTIEWRKASREYLFGKKKESTKARCCECGVECDKSMMAWVGEGVYKCKLCLLMRRNDG